MNATATRTQTADIEQPKARLKTTWMTGDYDLFSRYMEQGAEHGFIGQEAVDYNTKVDAECLQVIAIRAGFRASHN